MNKDPRGTIIQHGQIMRIDNAFVEEVSCFNCSVGYIVISYAELAENQTVQIRNIRLNVSGSTVVLNSFGQTMCLCRIREGMWVDVVFSSIATRSIPPQSNAFLIITQRESQPPSSVTIGRIAFVDKDNHFLYTGNPRDINSQVRFTVSEATTISNRAGNPISLSALRPGQMVKITHANFQTASIPPQTAAFHIQLL